MSNLLHVSTDPPVAPAAGRRVLIVDDSRMQRSILRATLLRAGYQVAEAESGEEALALCSRDDHDLVLSDWVMPGMSGLEFCRAFRALPREHYGYFILLTSKSDKADIALGLDMGADDFLTKPVSGPELRARLAAGERILRMEHELTEKNRLLGATLAKVQSLNDAVTRDLIEAAALQQSLLRERHRTFGSAEVSLLLRPSGHVGGDLVGFFPINARRVGLFAIDVSGHGIASAMMTARLAGYLSGNSPSQNVALIETDLGIYDARDPADLAAHLNDLVLREMQSSNYLTLVYADVDLVSGLVRLVQAGHPSPVVQRRGGLIEFHGTGGFPIGLVAEAGWETLELTLHPGDRLLLMSDGMLELTNVAGAQLGEAGLEKLLVDLTDQRGPALLEALQWGLDAWAAGEPEDDMSGVLFEFHGPKANAD